MKDIRSQTELWQYLGDLTNKLHSHDQMIKQQSEEITKLKKSIHVLTPVEYFDHLRDCGLSVEESKSTVKRRLHVQL